MTRGELLKAVFAGDFGKPRPALVVQSDHVNELATVVVCPLTSDLEGAGPLRVPIEPSDRNGLERTSLVMIEKIAAVSKTKTREVIGQVTDAELAEVDARLAFLLALGN